MCDVANSGNMTHKHRPKMGKLRGGSNDSKYVVTEEIKQTALSV
jgi:hypothetical protein